MNTTNATRVSNQVAVRSEQPKLMLLDYMADKYALRTEEFSKTVRATCGLSNATAEQFAAFLIVAKQYNLNPITKEIYAFPGKGGGIVPIVSIDGWVNLINSHGQCDGFEFEMEHSADGLISCTCKMYRKDRSHPVIVTEYLSECKRATDPWKMEHRMLRHKALIQAARYAFGFAGVYDEDEARNIVDNEPRDVTPMRRVPSPSEMIDGPEIDMVADEVPPAPDTTSPEPGPTRTAAPQGRQQTEPVRPAGYPNAELEPDAFVIAAQKRMDEFDNQDDLSNIYETEIMPAADGLFKPDVDSLRAYYEKRLAKIGG